VPSAEQRDRRVARESRWQRENNELRERLGRYEQAQQQDWQRREAEALEQARNQGPEAVAQYIADRSERRAAAMFAYSQRQTADSSDRVNFQMLVRDHPNLQRLADQVEEQHQRLLATDPNYRPNRVAVAKYLMGEHFFERGSNASSGQQRRRANEGVQRETTRAPSSTASQVPSTNSGRRRARSFADLTVEEMEAQLANIPVRTR
jgi:hypothetical protein